MPRKNYIIRYVTTTCTAHFRFQCQFFYEYNNEICGRCFKFLNFDISIYNTIQNRLFRHKQQSVSRPTKHTYNGGTRRARQYTNIRGLSQKSRYTYILF